MLSLEESVNTVLGQSLFVNLQNTSIRCVGNAVLLTLNREGTSKV